MNYIKPALLILIVVWISTWILGRGSTPHWRHGLPFLLSTLFWISSTLSVVLAVIILFGRKQISKDSGVRTNAIRPWNRRQSFRVEYPEDQRPMLIIEKSDDKIRRQLEFSVVDLSEDGLRFIDDGSLGEVNELAGQLRFLNGALKPIAGRIVRRTDRYMSLCLQQGVEWSTLLEEQRVVIRRLNESAE